MDQLERIRMSRSGLFRDRSDLTSVARGYAAAFKGAGLAVEGDEKIMAVRVQGSAIREELIASLDDWALVTPDTALRAQLLRTARLADPDPTWRDRVRDPVVWGDRQALERLAAEALGARGRYRRPNS